jgi:hypothetical protein
MSCQGGECDPVPCQTGSSPGSWSFESDTLEGWNSDLGQAIAVSANHPRTGSAFSLVTHLDSTAGPVGGHIGFVAPLCPNKTVNLAGRTVLAKIYVEGTSVHEDGELRFMVAVASNDATGSNEIPVVTYNQWVPVQFAFPANAVSATATALTIVVNMGPDVGSVWIGNVYLDDVIIQ